MIILLHSVEGFNEPNAVAVIGGLPSEMKSKGVML